MKKQTEKSWCVFPDPELEKSQGHQTLQTKVSGGADINSPLEKGLERNQT